MNTFKNLLIILYLFPVTAGNDGEIASRTVGNAEPSFNPPQRAFLRDICRDMDTLRIGPGVAPQSVQDGDIADTTEIGAVEDFVGKPSISLLHSESEEVVSHQMALGNSVHDKTEAGSLVNFCDTQSAEQGAGSDTEMTMHGRLTFTQLPGVSNFELAQCYLPIRNLPIVNESLSDPQDFRLSIRGNTDAHAKAPSSATVTTRDTSATGKDNVATQVSEQLKGVGLAGSQRHSNLGRSISPTRSVALYVSEPSNTFVADVQGLSTSGGLPPVHEPIPSEPQDSVSLGSTGSIFHAATLDPSEVKNTAPAKIYDDDTRKGLILTDSITKAQVAPRPKKDSDSSSSNKALGFESGEGIAITSPVPKKARGKTCKKGKRYRCKDPHQVGARIDAENEKSFIVDGVELRVLAYVPANLPLPKVFNNLDTIIEERDSVDYGAD